ncbi:Tad domain-containing protein [Bosea sp. LC85]|uniref:Tad domain-containing protein n=1 Tax=Bosea sp. LC85 TaxID=1502851 RepID=UPI001376D3C0|nr:Tad domain-containing protein [Bosea sp. LC85]
MIFAIMLVPLIALIGILVDTSQAQNARVDLQSALDSAVLAAAKLNESDSERIAAANRYLAAALPPGFPGTAVISSFAIVDGAASVKGDASADVKTMFGNFIGGSSTRIASTAKALIARPQVRHLDLVMCIDATGSMQYTLNAVKNAALYFEKNLNDELKAKQIDPFESMRVKPIFYRDFGGNSGWKSDPRDYGDRPPMKVGEFWRLPDQATLFSTFVSPERATGGGDLPESGLECVNEGMNSSWIKAGATVVGGASAGQVITASFNVIAVWTDADAHPPSHSQSLKNPDYPAADIMPRTWTGTPPSAPGLTYKWNSSVKMDQENKLLVFFGNSGTPNWLPVKNWAGFFQGGTLTEGNTQLVKKLALAIATKTKTPTLTH